MALVLDRSGSMEGQIEGVHAFSNAVLDQLSLQGGGGLGGGGGVTGVVPSSQAAVIIFNSNAHVTQALTPNRSLLDEGVLQYDDPQGPTNIGGALMLARTQLMSADGLRVVMLLSVVPLK